MQFDIKSCWNGADLCDANLCGADLCDANLCDADLCDANLRGADLRGADLCGADLCGADLRGANLRGADLCGADLCDADLRGADFRDANLRGADLCGANLCDADLRGADFRGADFRGANLRGAKNLPKAPVVPNIDSAILAAIKSGGKLDMDIWHTCETAHCRAGWAITLAGEAGKELESKTSSQIAGMLIYMASRPGVPVPDFFATNSEAMADLEKCAAECKCK